MKPQKTEPKEMDAGKNSSGEVPELLRQAHFIGIGGAGMSGIARILLVRGAKVSGSDAKESRTLLALRAQGAQAVVGSASENLDVFPGGPSAVVISTAIKDDNAELVAARERGIPVLHRSQALAALMDGYRVACVSGTHGKTSTTSMLTVALQHCQLDPSFAIGGELSETGSNAHHGQGEIFVAEADESDSSFLRFSPSVAVILNVEADHLDQHGTPEAYAAVFDKFVHRIQPDGVLVVCADDPGAAKVAEQAEADGRRVRRYGRSAVGADDLTLLSYTPSATGVQARFALAGKEYDFTIGVPGEHSAYNALAALAAGVELGAPIDDLIDGLAGFSGVRRRFEFKGLAGGVRVYDDYAHNPTKVTAQVRAARHAAGAGRLVVVFQPHLYSRTKAFATEFARGLGLADEVIVLDVFGAREEPEPGVNGALIANQISTATVHYEPAFDRAAVLAAKVVRPGDLLITMGAGSVTQLGSEILAELDRRVDAGLE